jgi:hypothetical protein
VTTHPDRYTHMHFHDRTLLSSLGFADQDKKDPLHELACRYMYEKVESLGWKDPQGMFTRTWKAEYEVPLCDRWNKPVAFLDVLLTADIEMSPDVKAILAEVKEDYEEWNMLLDQWYHFAGLKRNGDHRWVVPVEVKVGKVPVGDVLRQVNTYRTLGARGDWTVAVCWEPSADFVETLKHEGVHTVQLGDAFRAWAKEKSEKKVATLVL